MVDHVRIAHVDLGVGTVEDAVGQLRGVDDGAPVVLVVHGEVMALVVIHAVPGGMVMVVEVVPDVHHQAGTRV